MSCENVELPVSKAARSPRKRLLLTGIVVLLLLIPLVRLAWVTSRTETGWETISQQWRDATVGLVAGEHQPISSREPVEQAAFWLRETQRIVAAEPENPELAMGAALLLASPAWASSFAIFASAASPAPRLPQLHRSDRPSRQHLQEQCHPSAWQWPPRQQNCNPTSRAGGGCGRCCSLPVKSRRPSRAARVPDWLGVLRQCRKHDPDNALYDYLAT